MKTLPPIAEEFEGCELADLRLLDRVVQIAAALEVDPSSSLPGALKGRGQLEAAYRFFGNDRVELPDILKGHIEKTVERLGRHDRCLAIHDTTDFSFEGQRVGLGTVDRAQQGFYGHFCLAVAPGAEPEPFGLLAIDTWMRLGKKGKRSTQQRLKETGLESERWLRQSTDVEALVGGTKLIHVEDREGDIYASLASRIDKGMHFIVRSKGGRVVLHQEGEEDILEHVRRLPRHFTREVSLSSRQPRISLSKAHSARRERTARMAFAASSITLRRPLKAKGGRKQLELNAIHVLEVGKLSEGEEPVEWLLFTTEPIKTKEDIEFVVDSYRGRWLIEEYFKVLKTGCAYEKRQLESGEALLRALGVFAILAWRLLVLRHQERTGGNTPAEAVATPEEIAVLRAKKLLPRKPTVADFLAAIAQYGGHLKNNGPPGIQVLWRGFRQITALAEGWALAQKCDQS